jgi:hypothetical protein
MEWGEARKAAGLDGAVPVRHQSLSFVLDVLASPGVAEAATAAVLGAFALRADQLSRPLLPAERVPLWGVFDLSTPEGPRFVLFVDGVIALDAPRIEQAVDLLSWNLNTYVAAAARDYFVLHAGCLSVPNSSSALLLSAPSGAGKSTLTAALVQRGFGYLSDEFAPIDPVSGKVYPYPKPINLKAGSFSLFPGVPGVPADVRAGHWHLSAEALAGSIVTEPCDVQFVVFPRWSENASLSITRLSGGAVVMALAEQSLSRPFYGIRTLDVLTRLARSTRGIRLEYSSTADAVAAIDDLVGDCVATAARN